MMSATKTLQLPAHLLLLLVFIHTVCAQNNCPAADAACRCDDNNIVCVDLGQRAVMPAFNSSPTVYSTLSFQGHTRILEIQSAAFAGLRVATLDLSGLGLTSMDQDAFSGLDM